jgi:Na+/melibiose symporter-like transporter
VAHLAIINGLTYGQRRRDKMINQRNAFTYIANVTVLSMALIVFVTVSNAPTQFRILAFSSVAIGCCTSVFYIINIREKPLCEEAIKYEEAYRGEKIDTDNA